MAHKQAVLADADQAYGELTEAVGGLSDSELTQVFLGVWGTREILIHVAAWDREMAVALDRVGRGEAPYPDGKYDDFNDWNAGFVAARRVGFRQVRSGRLAAAHLQGPMLIMHVLDHLLSLVRRLKQIERMWCRHVGRRLVAASD